MVFEGNYRRSSSATVRAIYYFTPADISDGLPVWDVPTQSVLLDDRGNDPISGKPYAEILATGVMNAPYTRSTEPFEIVKDTLYYVGDNEVAVYLLKADIGTRNKTDNHLILIDTGWPNSGYQYWKNIEAVGCNPREITDVFISHGHVDHYGTVEELVRMINNSGRSVRIYASREDVNGIKTDALGNSWDIEPSMSGSARTLFQTHGRYYAYDAWMDFGNVRILPTLTPGHTVGTTSFVFDVENPRTGKRLTFGFMGGYGVNGLTDAEPSVGFRRLSIQQSLARLEQLTDVDYVAASHTNQYPIVEIYQALKAYNNNRENDRRRLDMLDALRPGEYTNCLEKRYAVITNAISDTRGYQSIENYGPYKLGREHGAKNTEVEVLDSGKVVQGYDKFLNVNAKIPMLTNGIDIHKDTYVHDPSGYYAQFYVDVHDSYGGYLPNIGPVESYHPESGAPEVLRTERLDSLEEAQAIVDSIVRGGTYRVDLTAASAIVVPSEGSVFRQVESR